MSCFKNVFPPTPFQFAIALITKCNNTFLGCSVPNVLTHTVQQATHDCPQTQILNSIITILCMYCYEQLMLILLSINNGKQSEQQITKCSVLNRSNK